MKIKITTSSQSGQIGIIMVLLMSALLTLGLSAASNTNRDLITSQQEEESSRVFNAAEAGIEQGLSTDVGFSGQTSSGTVSDINNVAVDYVVSKSNVLQAKVFEGMSAMIDLTGSNAGNIVRIYWSKENNCATEDPASLIITIVKKVGAVVTSRYITAAACARSDGFDSGQVSTVNVDTLRRLTNVPLEANDIQMRIKPVYNDTNMKVDGSNWTMPTQSYVVRSQAKSELGNETRTVEVTKTLPTAPAFMDYAVFSGTDIVK